MSVFLWKHFHRTEHLECLNDFVVQKSFCWSNPVGKLGKVYCFLFANRGAHVRFISDWLSCDFNVWSMKRRWANSLLYRLMVWASSCFFSSSCESWERLLCCITLSIEGNNWEREITWKQWKGLVRVKRKYVFDWLLTVTTTNVELVWIWKHVFDILTLLHYNSVVFQCCMLYRYQSFVCHLFLFLYTKCEPTIFSY